MCFYLSDIFIFNSNDTYIIVIYNNNVLRNSEVLKMIIISFMGIKGGIGKTTLAYNFAEFLAKKKNKKVLLLDLDQQNSLTNLYGITDPEGTVASIFSVYEKTKPKVKIHEVEKNIGLIAGSTILDDIQARLETYANKNIILYRWLAEHMHNVVDNFDYLIIDCHPDLSIAAKNAAIVSDCIYAPVTPTKFSYDSLTDLEIRIDALRKEAINPVTGETLVSAKIYYLANMIQKNTHITRDFLNVIRDEKKDGKPWIVEIPKRELFNRSTYDSVPIVTMEEVANGQKIDIPSQTAEYAKRQKNEHYHEINNIFDKMKEIADMEA
jgi:chromosome partitioning protein